MEDSIEVRHRYHWYFRWAFFLGGIFLTYIWITAKVITSENTGLPISDAERQMCIFFFFPLFWGVGFIPHSQVERLTIDASGVRTLDSRSKTIFHRRVFTNGFVPAKDVSHIEISEDPDDNTLDVGICFNQSSGKPGYIALSNYPKISSATEGANKAARLLCCKVNVKATMIAKSP